MIPMLSCLFCKRKRRLFNIYKIYGRTERPITSYIISFFGDVEEYLKEDHGICSTCVLLLNKLIYIKNFMVKTIIDDSVNSDTYVSFSSAYKLFLHNLDKLNFDDGDAMEDGGVSDLLKPMHSTPCEIDYDYSSDRNTPYIDQEVEKVFRPQKRKRRRSTKSTIGDDSGVSPPCLRYDADGRLLNKRTRSVSRLLNAMQEDVDCGEQEKHDFERDNVSHHELLAKYLCCECRSGRFTALDFVHHKASEEMTDFYRIDYNDNPNNNSNHISENTMGDFNVKILIQKGKINESPVLRFQESPELNSSITLSINTSTTQTSQHSSVDDSELDTGQENSSIASVRNQSVNSSIGESSETNSEVDFYYRNEVIEDSEEENKIEEENEEDKIIEESQDKIIEEDQDKIIEEDQDKIIEEKQDKIIEEDQDKIIEEDQDKIIEENQDKIIEENQDKIIHETQEDVIIEGNEGDKIIEENQDDIIIEEKEEDKIIKENEEIKIVVQDKIVEENKIIEESVEDEEISLYIPSALEPERMVRDIIDTSSSESETHEDFEKAVPKKELKVIVKRMIIDEALLRRLHRFPTQRRRRRRNRRGVSIQSQESRSSGIDTESESFDSD